MDIWLVNEEPFRETYLYSTEEAAYKAAWNLINRVLKGKEQDTEYVSIDYGTTDGHNEIEEVFLYSFINNERCQ